MTRLEQILKQKLDKVEVPYNPSHWAEMEQMLASQATGMSTKTKLFIGAAAVITGITLGGLFMNNDATTDSTVNKNDITATKLNAETNSFEESQVVLTEASNETAAQEAHSTTIHETENVSENQVNETETVSADQVNESPKQATIENNSSLGNTATTPVLKSGSSTSGWGKFSVSQTEVCQRKGVTFSIDGEGAHPVSFLWNFGDGNTSSQPSPTHEYTQVGSFDITLTLTTIATGVDTVQSKANLITVLAAPDYHLELALSNVMDVESEASFEAVGLKENETIDWNLGDGTSSQERSFIHRYEVAKLYEVKATALNNTTGCTTNLTDKIKVENDYNLLAPTGFIPSSLIEVNQTFIPIGLKNLEEGYTFLFEIFNPRNGMEKIYSVMDYQGWNGRVNNTGERLNTGMYSWVAIVTKPDGTQKKYMGSVLLAK